MAAGTFDAGIYVYPWDVVGDPAAAERVAGLGVGHATVAAFYHATRALTPRHPGHRVVVAERSAAYLPVGPAWSHLLPEPSFAASFHATPRPRVSLANTGVDMATLPTGTTGVVVNCWNGSAAPVEASVETIGEVLGEVSGEVLPGRGHGVQVYAGLLGIRGMGGDPEGLARVIAEVRAAGAAGVRIYHAGLAGADDLTAIGKALADA